MTAGRFFATTTSRCAGDTDSRASQFVRQAVGVFGAGQHTDDAALAHEECHEGAPVVPPLRDSHPSQPRSSRLTFAHRSQLSRDPDRPRGCSLRRCDFQHRVMR